MNARRKFELDKGTWELVFLLAVMTATLSNIANIFYILEWVWEKLA